VFGTVQGLHHFLGRLITFGGVLGHRLLVDAGERFGNARDIQLASHMLHEHLSDALSV